MLRYRYFLPLYRSLPLEHARCLRRPRSSRRTTRSRSKPRESLFVPRLLAPSTARDSSTRYTGATAALALGAVTRRAATRHLVLAPCATRDSSPWHPGATDALALGAVARRPVTWRLFQSSFASFSSSPVAPVAPVALVVSSLLQLGLTPPCWTIALSVTSCRRSRSSARCLDYSS